MGGQWSALSPTSSAEHSKNLRPVTQLDNIPVTEQQARAGCIKILKEMEYRSVRAAKMAYVNSDKYELIHVVLTSLVTLTTGMLAFGGSNYVVGKFQSMPKSLKIVGFGCSLTLTPGVGVWFYQTYGNLLPQIKEKQEALNKAGAAWQTFELKLRTFRTTSLLHDMSLSDLREKCDQLAVERSTICEIAKPCQWIHDKYVKDYEILLESKRKDPIAIDTYFEVENGKPTQQTNHKKA